MFILGSLYVSAKLRNKYAIFNHFIDFQNLVISVVFVTWKWKNEKSEKITIKTIKKIIIELYILQLLDLILINIFKLNMLYMFKISFNFEYM